MQIANILLIDGNKEQFSSMSKMLEESNFQVTRAQSINLLNQKIHQCGQT